jgi:hypothetical protein
MLFVVNRSFFGRDGLYGLETLGRTGRRQVMCSKRFNINNINLRLRPCLSPVFGDALQISLYRAVAFDAPNKMGENLVEHLEVICGGLASRNHARKGFFTANNPRKS